MLDAIEQHWAGNLTANRADWRFSLSSAQQDTIINVLDGINQGTIVVSSGCSAP